MSEQLENLGIWIPRVVSERTDLSQTAKLVYGIVHGFTSNGKECFASNKTIGGWVGCASDTVCTAVALLVEKDLVTSEIGNNSDRRLKSRTPTAKTPYPHGENAVPPTAKTPYNSIGDNKEIKNTNTPIPPKGDCVIDQEFEEWYKLYPKKVARGTAERAYKKARKLTTQLILIEGVKKLARRVAAGRIENQYIKHPATWLNGKCWLDQDNTPPQGNVGVYN